MRASALGEQKRVSTVAIAALVLLYAAGMANWRYGGLRFSWPILNGAALLAALVVPGLLIAIALRRLKGWPRIGAVLLLVAPVAHGTLYALVVSLHLVFLVVDGGHDASFERIATVPVQGGRIAIYRTNCGATCSYGIAVRQERPLLPGLLLVRNFEGFYPAAEITYEVLGPHQVRVAVPPYLPDRPNTAGSRIYTVKPGVYF